MRHWRLHFLGPFCSAENSEVQDGDVESIRDSLENLT